jgi:hypothetical protein
MKRMRRAASLFLLLSLLAGCLVDIQEPTRTPTPTASASPTQTPSPAPTDVPSPTPGLEAVPQLAAGDRITVSAPGLRVRARPGIEQRVITSLGIGARLLVALGPVWVDNGGWYMVQDADRADPKFATGWVAAGLAIDPFLQPADFSVRRNPYLAGFAGTNDGEFGPVTLPDANVSIRWLASPSTSAGCDFFVDLATADGKPVRTIRATIGGVPAPGELFPDFFAAHDQLTRTEIFVTVRSDCSWALTFVHERPERTSAG